MKRLIELFDRAYIINLEDRSDRRRQAEREFARIGVSIPSEKVRFYTATRPADKGTFPDVGTRGNYTSHRAILDLAIKDNLRNVLVFEDDISFRSVGDAVIEKITEQFVKENWDVVYFGYLQPSDDGLVGPLVNCPGDILGAHFYAVNGRFIGKMLDYMNRCEFLPPGHPEGGPITADGAYNHVRYVTPNVRVLLAVPNLAYQRSSRTDIHPTGILDRIALLRPVLLAARAVKHGYRMTIDRKRLGHPPTR